MAAKSVARKRRTPTLALADEAPKWPSTTSSYGSTRAAVPEPGTIALVAGAAIMMFACRRLLVG